MTRIHVICGGDSSEREVSLRSGTAVTQALQKMGYEVSKLDLAVTALDEVVACDVVFPVLHGAGGEDGTFQRELEEHNTKYVGSDSMASALCFDKWRYREIVLGAGLPVAQGALVGIDTYQENELANGPYVLKPFNGGSSIDTYIVRDPLQAPHELIADTFSRYPSLLMEQLIVGTELTVGVLGDTALPIIEIIPPVDGEFDYENKYNGATQELCPPQNVSESVQKRAQELALQAHQLTHCRDFSRTDIMYETATDKLYILETNTIPGMTDQSLFPKMARTAGIEMPELCQQLVEMALSR